jgi:hypothetical protein
MNEINLLRSLYKMSCNMVDGRLKGGFINHDDPVNKAIDTAISALEAQQADRWISVSSGRLPKNEERVMICANRKTYKGDIIKIRTIAMYEDGTLHTDNSGYNWNECEFEYCDDTEDYIIPEGWWEQSMYCEQFAAVDDFVTHWKPLDKPCKEE